jgi:hypothetical protein
MSGKKLGGKSKQKNKAVNDETLFQTGEFSDIDSSEIEDNFWILNQIEEGEEESAKKLRLQAKKEAPQTKYNK